MSELASESDEREGTRELASGKDSEEANARSRLKYDMFCFFANSGRKLNSTVSSSEDPRRFAGELLSGKEYRDQFLADYD